MLCVRGLVHTCYYDYEMLYLQIASKEGYLTKLGYHRKVYCSLCFEVYLKCSLQNWRTRWFVLYKNELRYFKTREVLA